MLYAGLAKYKNPIKVSGVAGLLAPEGADPFPPLLSFCQMTTHSFLTQHIFHFITLKVILFG